MLASVAGHHACTWVGPDGLPGEGEFFTGDPYGLAAATLSVLANIIATAVIGLTAWCVVQTLPSRQLQQNLLRAIGGIGDIGSSSRHIFSASVDVRWPEKSCSYSSNPPCCTVCCG